jgi:Undecaprenyl-phosphate glucose phosphotransferase
MTAFNSEAEPRRAPVARWRLPLSYGTIEPCVITLDALLILVTSLATGVAYNLAIYGERGELIHFVAVAGVVGALVIPLAKLRGLYAPSNLLKLSTQVAGLALIWVGAFLFLTSIVFALKIGGAFSRGSMLAFAAGGLGVLLVERAFWHVTLSAALKSGRLKARHIVLIGEPSGVGRAALAALNQQGLRISKHIAIPAAGDGDGEAVAAIVAETLAHVRGSEIEEVFVAAGIERLSAVTAIIAGLRVLPLPIRFVPDAATSALVGRPAQPLGSSIAVEVQRAPLSPTERAAKRGVDVGIAATALVLLAPLLALTALAIKLDTPGPVLFRQQRRGFNGRHFRILKFRSMSVMEDGADLRQARRHDARVTRVGRFIRATSIDELPQLFNVLSGTMSLVGPRPHALAHDSYYDDLIGRYAWRHHVKPGLTGWAQVNGSRGETPTLESMARRVEFDLWYVDNWSLWLDMRIMLRTSLALMRTPAY